MLTVTENQPALLVSFQRSGVPSARNGAIFSAFMADEVSAKPETAQEGGAGPQGPLPRDNRDEPASDPAMGAGLPAHREEPDNDLLAGAVMGPRQGQEPRPGPQPVTVSGHERAADAPGPQARDLTEPPAAATTPPRGAQLTDARVTSLSPTWTNADPDTRAPLGRLPLPGIATVREGPQNAPASPRAASPAPPGTTLLHGAGTTIERALGLARHADSREAPGRGGSPTAPLATQPGLAWISGHRTNADMAGDARIDTVAPADITPDARTDPAAPGPAP
ncbi:MAG: hypothetical protein IBX58_17655, partial [Roseovarius sp.]|nr:hypothetical protein [Roseovarius sp.]